MQSGVDTGAGHWTGVYGEPRDPHTHLEKCVWIACVEAPEATNGTMLTHLVYNGSDYLRNETEVLPLDIVEYHCFNGMRSETNLSFSHQVANCTLGLAWDGPTQWEQCTESTWPR